jgi:uncharacterized protein
MTLTFDQVRMAARIKELNHWSQVAFTLSCVERMAPNYRAFQKQESWGDFEPIATAIEYAWTWLRSSNVTMSPALAAECEA